MNTVLKTIHLILTAAVVACFVSSKIPEIVTASESPITGSMDITHTARNLDDVHAASCRVVCSRPGSRTGSIGTGTVVLRDAGKYWIITNWHVVNGYTVFKLQFFRDGKIVEVAATLEKSWHNDRAPWDFAVLTVPQERLAAYNPPIVPLAGPDIKPLTDRPIYSSGCSEGRWSLAWKGSVESYYGNTAQFYPAPKSGQSGSAIVQKLDDGLRVTGILTWRVGDERSAGEEQMRGGAIPIAHFYDAATGRLRTSDGKAIPPNATWCTDIEPIGDDTRADRDASDSITPAIPGGNAPVLVWPVQSASAYFDSPAANYDDLIMFFFVGPGCPHCDQVKPIVNRLINDGYNITTVDSATDAGKKQSKECEIDSWPTFILCRDVGDKYTGLERWTGADACESRIKAAFAKHAKRGLPPAPKAPKANNETKSEDTTTSATAARRKKDKPITPPKDACPSTGDADNNSGTGSGDVSPLLGGYGHNTTPTQPLDAVPQKPIVPDTQDATPAAPQQPDNNGGRLKKWKAPTPAPKTDGTEAGLLDKITAPLTGKLDAMVDGLEKKVTDKLDAITADLSNRAEAIAREKLNELKPGIMEQIRIFIWAVIWRAAVIIAIVWFGYYWLLKLLGLCGGVTYAVIAAVAANLPTIEIKRPAHNEDVSLAKPQRREEETQQ